MSNPTTATYRPNRDGMSSRRGAEARVLRRLRAADAQDRRDSQFPHVMQYVPGAGWTDQVVTPYLIDGLHPHNTSQRAFGPAEARRGRGPAADHLRRACILDAAADRMISRGAMADLSDAAWAAEESYRTAFADERRRRFASLHALEVSTRRRCDHEWHSYEYENGHHGQTCRLCGSTSR